MTQDDKTVYAGDVAIPDADLTAQRDETVYAEEATRPGGAADAGQTPPGRESPSGREDESERVELGALLLGTYRVKAGPFGGGFGKVWRVRHLGWNVDLALKQPRADMFGNAEQKASFIAECDRWIELGLHPRIVTCHYVREVGGIPSIFAEWMEGGSLREWMASGKLYAGGQKEALERVLDIAAQSALGLEYAQIQNLVHRDVKPENLLLTAKGSVKVADFGISGERGTASTALTLAYCSPEQALGKEVDRASDAYSWALCVLEMFLGGRSWGSGVAVGADLEEYLARDMRLPMPEGLKDLLRDCLSLEPRWREGLSAAAEELSKIYARALGCPYPHQYFGGMYNNEDLNNRALSQLDLGNPEKADLHWGSILAGDCFDPVAVYNRFAHNWRRGKVDDREALGAMRRAYSDRPGDAGTALLYARMALESFDYALAEEMLAGISREEAGELLRGARACPRPVFLEGADRDAAKAYLLAKRKAEGDPLARMKAAPPAGMDPSGLSAACLSPDGRYLLCGNDRAQLVLYAGHGGERLRELNLQEDRIGEVIRIVFSGDGSRAAAYLMAFTGMGSRIVLLDTPAWLPVASVDAMPHFDLSADGRFLLAADYDNAVLCSAGSGRCLRTYTDAERKRKIGEIRTRGDDFLVWYEDNSILSIPVPTKEVEPFWQFSRIPDMREMMAQGQRFARANEQFDDCLRQTDVRGALEALSQIRLLPQFANTGHLRWKSQKAGKFCRIREVLGILPSDFREVPPNFVVQAASRNQAYVCRQHGPHTLLVEKTDLERGLVASFRMGLAHAHRLAISDDGNVVVACQGDLYALRFELWVVREERLLHAMTESFDCPSPSDSDAFKIFMAPRGDAFYILTPWHVEKRLFAGGEHSWSSWSPEMGFAQTGAELVWRREGDFTRAGAFDLNFDGSRALIGLRETALPGQAARWAAELFDTADGKTLARFGRGRDEPRELRFCPDERFALLLDTHDRLGYWETVGDRCLASLGDLPAKNIRFVPDNACSAVCDNVVLEFDYAYEFPGWTDWDEAVLPYARNFLALNPAYADGDFDRLIAELQSRGFGYVRPEGVRAKLEELRTR